MDKKELMLILKPDKMKAGFFIAFIILILILPLYPSHIDRTVTFNNTGSVEQQEYDGYSLEILLFVIHEDFSWEQEYLDYHAWGSVRVSETITCNPVHGLIYIVYFAFAYAASCSLAFYGREEYQGLYVLRKKKLEDRAITSNKFRNCVDCGGQVPVLSDGSGICPECKRGYMDEKSWKSKGGQNIKTKSSEPQSLKMDLGVVHWDKYQPDVDNIGNNEKLFKFSPILIIITIVASIFLMAASIIITYSEVKYVDINNSTLQITGGLVLNWLISALSGFYLGKHIKRARFGVIIIILSTLIAIYLGLTYGEVIFNAYHPNFGMRFIIEIFNTTFFALVASMVSFSKYHFDQS